MPSSWCLMTIASAQAKAGDLDGAATFAEAAKEAEGGGAVPPAPGTSGGSVTSSPGAASRRRPARPSSGLSRPCPAWWATSRRTVGPSGPSPSSSRTRRGSAREDDRNRRTAPRVLQAVFRVEPDQERPRRVRPAIAAALAAVGDFEAAFRWSEGVENGGNVLARSPRLRLRPSTGKPPGGSLGSGRAAREDESADETYFGLSDLAEAQARLGDVEGARPSAGRSGKGLCAAVTT